jgi:aminoglycoside phosphotransferase
VIFKEGNADKLQKEKENIEKWGMIMPGIVPAVMGFNRNGGSASIVLEYLKGTSYKDIIVNGKMDFLKESFSTLTRDIRKVWLSTKQDFPVHGKYLEQLCSRLDDVYAVHPDFKSGKSMIGELETPPFDDIIKKILSVDKKTFAPFAVMIHGDFNIDNLIYDPNENCIRFIDLHRSVCGDYVQDVSVFILSNFRLPFFDRTIRKKINWAINEFFMFAADFADEQKDTEFEKRLALGLIRSFVTSTRFELDPEFSKLMYMKAVYLAEKLIEHEAEPGEIFRLPEEILTY